MRRIDNIVLHCTNDKVYGLKVIGDDRIRYVGITKHKLSDRLRGHKKDNRRNIHKQHWMKKHVGNIEIILIEGEQTREVLLCVTSVS